ncbi:hypothetical protein ACH5RR_007927 [Cinchona calisaya]|uniref:Uncharacterized protein n=1 Tax=Cinchona calisaya TaxID=153742 RepID=A0ABD3A9X9_9GENT
MEAAIGGGGGFSEKKKSQAGFNNDCMDFFVCDVAKDDISIKSSSADVAALYNDAIFVIILSVKCMA